MPLFACRRAKIRSRQRCRSSSASSKRRRAASCADSKAALALAPTVGGSLATQNDTRRPSPLLPRLGADWTREEVAAFAVGRCGADAARCCRGGVAGALSTASATTAPRSPSSSSSSQSEPESSPHADSGDLASRAASRLRRTRDASGLAGGACTTLTPCSRRRAAAAVADEAEGERASRREGEKLEGGLRPGNGAAAAPVIITGADDTLPADSLFAEALPALHEMRRCDDSLMSASGKRSCWWCWRTAARATPGCGRAASSRAACACFRKASASLQLFTGDTFRRSVCPR